MPSDRSKLLSKRYSRRYFPNAPSAGELQLLILHPLQYQTQYYRRTRLLRDAQILRPSLLEGREIMKLNLSIQNTKGQASTEDICIFR